MLFFVVDVVVVGVELESREFIVDVKRGCEERTLKG